MINEEENREPTVVETDSVDSVPDMVQQVRELLNAEKWTRATISNYSITKFRHLDEIIEQIVAQDIEGQIGDLCEAQLRHSKNSIVALYLSGVLNLLHHSVNDTNLITLIELFAENRKWNIVECLAQRILESGENKIALRALADCYTYENRQDQLHAVWERLIKIDFEETDIVKQLAEIKEQQGLSEEAVEYYKKVLHRYIGKQNFPGIRLIWQKLIDWISDDIEFFLNIEAKISKQVGWEHAAQLLEDLYPHFKQKESWDQAIDILKRTLSYTTKNDWARKEIVECYRMRYAEHSNLEEFIRISNLNQGWRNIHDAIIDFEKHISFDVGNFVFHRTWGVGIIRTIGGDSITIDFAQKRNHSMSFKMAVGALDVLPKDHIWVLRSMMNREKLSGAIKKNIIWALKIIIKSCDNSANMRRIKSELVPFLLTPNDWTTWSTKARDILKTNQEFGHIANQSEHFEVRDRPISFEERCYNRFQSERNFFKRIQIILEFATYLEDESAEGDSELFREIFSYFVDLLRHQAPPTATTLASYLLIRRILEKHPYLNPDINMDFRAFYESINDLQNCFIGIDNNDLRQDFLRHIRINIPNWAECYIDLFPYILSRTMLNELFKEGKVDLVKQLAIDAINNYRDSRELFVWFVRTCGDDEWFRELEIDHEKILISMIHLLDTAGRAIENRKNISPNRKLSRHISAYLFDDGNLSHFVEQGKEPSLNRIYTLLIDVKGIDPSQVITLKQEILNRYPKFRFYGDDQREIVSRGIITGPSSYAAKQREMQHLHTVEVPANSREIGEALQHGDLRENAEYKAAKERQEMLNNTIGRLKEDLERAQIMRPDEVDTSSIMFGSQVTLFNKDSLERESYTILGPWESDPERSIISYLSPFGSELCNHKVGDSMDFTINDLRYQYRVEAIAAANFK